MAENFMITGNSEILQVADAVAREKNIEKELVIEALESAIQSAGRKKYGHDNQIRADINRKNGGIQLFREWNVVEEFDEELEAPEAAHILLKDAQEKNPDAKLGDVISEPLPPIDFGRVLSQAAKQVISQKVREAVRAKEFEEFKDRVGEVVTGVVKRVEYGNLIIDFGKTETILRREQLIPNEIYRQGDRIRAFISDVREETRGPQVFLSRTAPEFLAELFTQEVPEIYDNIIQIKAVARDPGSRAKFAIYSTDPSIDPVGACVGVRGSRVQAVVNELQGEKIDIIPWSEDPAGFVVNALAPAEVSKIVIDEDTHRIEVVVEEDQLSLAIGRRGQNVRLASQLVGWNIDMITEEQDAERRMEEFKRLSEMFAEVLNVEEVIAQLLVTEGFKSIEEVAYVPIEDLAEIEGFDEDVATELRDRAGQYLEELKANFEKKIKEFGVKDDLLSLDGLTDQIIIKLAESGVKTRDDLGDLAADEFQEMVPDSGLSENDINELIMEARAHWFADEESEEAETSEESSEEEPKVANGA